MYLPWILKLMFGKNYVCVRDISDRDPFYLQDTVEKKLSQMILDKKFSGE